MSCGCRRWRSSRARTRWRRPFAKPWRFPMPLHDVSYKHWHGAHLGIRHRRLAIAFQGLKACLANRWMRHLVLLCWIAGLSLAAMLFAVGQLLVADSVIVEWTSGLNPMLQTFARNLMTWLDRHPEISV